MMKTALFTGCLLLIAANMSQAALIDVTIGDNDGFGLGVADNASGIIWPGLGPSGSNYDGRSGAEAAATDGSQFTDTYSTLDAFSPQPNPDNVPVDILSVSLGATLLSASFTIDMGDFQADDFGQLTAYFNGVAQPNLLNFQDGFRNSQVRTFGLDAAAIAQANADGAFKFALSHPSLSDFVSFDYFRFQGEDTGRVAVPEPASMALFGLGLACTGFSALRRRKSAG